MQLAYARAVITLASTSDQLDLLVGLLEGSRSVPGLVVDTDLRWSLLSRLVATGRAGDLEIDSELARDNTASGRRSASAARAAIPTAEAKEQAWTAAITDLSLPNAMLVATLSGLGIPTSASCTGRSVPATSTSSATSGRRAAPRWSGMVATALYPGLLIEPETVSVTNEFLAANDDLPARPAPDPHRGT